MPRVILIVFTLAVTIFAVVEIATTRPERFPSGQLPGGIPKAFWILIATLTAPLGGLAWIVISRVQLADEKGISLGEAFRRNREGAAAPAPEPVAPDDDPEFLWRLEKELYQRRKEARAAEAAGEANPQAGGGKHAGEANPQAGGGKHAGEADRLSAGDAEAKDVDGSQLDFGKEGHEDDDSSDAPR
ncbi:MAG: hypothetical protein Q4D73_03320 [Actinomycetaceae bacterium]|nr:hypothetical protein [Actinomycetaceae bacterium]